MLILVGCWTGFSPSQTPTQPISSILVAMPACSVCKKEFTKAKYLKQHRTTHLNKSIFCIFCNKVFARKFTLQRHINSAHLRNIKINSGDKDIIAFMESLHTPCMDEPIPMDHSSPSPKRCRVEQSMQQPNSPDAQPAAMPVAQPTTQPETTHPQQSPPSQRPAAAAFAPRSPAIQDVSPAIQPVSPFLSTVAAPVPAQGPADPRRPPRGCKAQRSLFPSPAPASSLEDETAPPAVPPAQPQHQQPAVSVNDGGVQWHLRAGTTVHLCLSKDSVLTYRNGYLVLQGDHVGMKFM